MEKSVKRSDPINTLVQTEFQALWCMYILCSSFVLFHYEERLLSLVGNKSLSLLNAANQPIAMHIGQKHTAIFPCLLCTSYNYVIQTQTALANVFKYRKTNRNQRTRASKACLSNIWSLCLSTDTISQVYKINCYESHTDTFFEKAIQVRKKSWVKLTY